MNSQKHLLSYVASAALFSILFSSVVFAAPHNTANEKFGVKLKALGPAPQICTQSTVHCCDNDDLECNGYPVLLTTRLGLMTLDAKHSNGMIAVGEKFTLTFTKGESDAGAWTFPDIADKVSSCRDGVDASCTYRARIEDVTYPKWADFYGWSKFRYTAQNIQGQGIGWGGYAIIGNGVDLYGRFADKTGKAIPHLSALFTKVGDKNIRYGGGSGQVLHTTNTVVADIGYYGMLVPLGTFKLDSNNPYFKIKCKPTGKILTFKTSGPKVMNFVCD